jgi:phenylalanyl-tRNA synthetase alpha chain
MSEISPSEQFSRYLANLFVEIEDRVSEANSSDVDAIVMEYVNEFIQEIGNHHKNVNNSAELDKTRIAIIGRSGIISERLRTIKLRNPEDRPKYSKIYNFYSQGFASWYEERLAGLQSAELEQKILSERVDITLPVAASPRGSVHPISQVMDELAEIFSELGYAVAEGPEIETDWHNFTALNIPPEHPARAMHDTFYFPDQPDAEHRMLLRTHTSPVQIRTMMETKPPIRVIAPGRVYRCDSDATHTPMFHQVEGLVIDRGITMGHLRWTLETFIKAFFEVDRITTRFRPSFFPFTEPSAELDVQCSWAGGTLTVGEGDSWLEILGCGMVHPKVIAACGLDPAEWQGFAFGCGIDRLAMLKYGMTDLRAFFDADLRWLRHYGFSSLDVPTLSGGVGS